MNHCVYFHSYVYSRLIQTVYTDFMGYCCFLEKCTVLVNILLVFKSLSVYKPLCVYKHTVFLMCSLN